MGAGGLAVCFGLEKKAIEARAIGDVIGIGGGSVIKTTTCIRTSEKGKLLQQVAAATAAAAAAASVDVYNKGMQSKHVRVCLPILGV